MASTTWARRALGLCAAVTFVGCGGQPMGSSGDLADSTPTLTPAPAAGLDPEPAGGQGDVGPARTRTWRVARDGSGDFFDVLSALSVARPGDTIRVAPGRYVGALVASRKEVAIIGEGEARDTIIDGGGEPFVVSVTEARKPGMALQHLTLTGAAPLSGEGLRTLETYILVSDVILEGNGRGAHIINSDATFVGCEFRGNVAAGGGAGLLVEGFGDSTISNSLIAHNYASIGGGIMLSGGALELRHTALVANGAGRDGGTIYAQSHPSVAADLSLINSVLAHTVRDVGVYINDSTVKVSVKGTDFFDNPVGDVGGAMVNPVGRSGNLGVDPLWVGGWPRGEFRLADLYLRPDSPLRDAGCCGGIDPDGSPADVGPHGGAYAHFSYYLDADEDGLYDGWEETHGTRLLYKDGHLDDDRDGVKNSIELKFGLDPQRADTDGDGQGDLDEILEGWDGLNPFIPDGQAEVPGQLARIDVALLRAPPKATLTLGAGTFLGPVASLGRAITVQGQGPGLTVLDGAGLGPVLTFNHHEGPGTLFRRLTLTGGEARNGGGLYVEDASPTLEDVEIAGNLASSGGGGAYLRGGAPVLRRVSLVGNEAIGSGGGMLLSAGAMTAFDLTAEGNRAARGGGIATSDEGDHTLVRPTLSANTSDSDGGGMYVNGWATVTLTNALVTANRASSGSGLHLGSGTLIVEQSTVVNNRGDGGGAVSSFSPYPVVLSRSILAHNPAGGLLLGSRLVPAPDARDTLLWDNDSGDLLAPDLPEWPAGLEVADPIFVAEPWSGEFSPATLHLTPCSPARLEGDTGPASAQLGMFGGPDGVGEWTEDLDEDGLPDGWERLWADTLDVLDPAGDLDGDGLSDLLEWDQGLCPTRSDTDGDGLSDGEELTSGGDPRVRDARHGAHLPSPSADGRQILDLSIQP